VARERRHLAAILAADVVGYSRLMGRYESGTLADPREHRKDRLDPALARYGGWLVRFSWGWCRWLRKKLFLQNLPICRS
jgi:class 3 adenylate cyclase